MITEIALKVCRSRSGNESKGIKISSKKKNGTINNVFPAGFSKAFLEKVLLESRGSLEYIPECSTLVVLQV